MQWSKNCYPPPVFSHDFFNFLDYLDTCQFSHIYQIMSICVVLILALTVKILNVFSNDKTLNENSSTSSLTS